MKKQIPAAASARLHLLARIHVHGAYGGQNGVWWLDTVEDHKLRPASMNKLLAAGDITEDDDHVVHLSEAAVADLEAEHTILETEQLTHAVAVAHLVRYWLYSRGSSPVRGLGITKGCSAECACGWKIRSNSGRAFAEDSARVHHNEELLAARQANS